MKIVITSGRQTFCEDVADLDAAITVAQRYTVSFECTAEDYLAVCALAPGAAVDLSCGACIAITPLESLPDLFGETLKPAAAPDHGAQLGMFEVARTSTFDAPAPAPMPDDRPLF